MLDVELLAGLDLAGMVILARFLKVFNCWAAAAPMTVSPLPDLAGETAARASAFVVEAVLVAGIPRVPADLPGGTVRFVPVRRGTAARPPAAPAVLEDLAPAVAFGGATAVVDPFPFGVFGSLCRLFGFDGCGVEVDDGWRRDPVDPPFLVSLFSFGVWTFRADCRARTFKFYCTEHRVSQLFRDCMSARNTK